MFDQPYLSSSPRDFWSNRWHQLIHESFVELAYKPSKSHLKPNILGEIIGVLGSFFISAAIHEYINYTTFGVSYGEHFGFFLFHGIIFLVWDLLTLPWFVEPYLREKQYHWMMHIICKDNI
ncbi:9137_t:CDS:2 [Entrophospora sp. SA101]|nr:9137_t:CDS:2 [Entrophospora sp. SA101]